MGAALQPTVRARLEHGGYYITSQIESSAAPDIVVVSDASGSREVTVFAPTFELRSMFERVLRSATLAEPVAGSAVEIMVGEGVAMLHVRSVMQKLLASPHTSLLLRGEPGSGKRTFARALHAAAGHGGALIEVSEPKQLELLRREPPLRPTSIYLGDLTRISAALQSKLQRLVKARPGNDAPTRFIAAVTGDLDSALRSGDLRPGLLNRFSVTLDIPALRERLEDIPLLARHLVAGIAREHDLPTPELSSEALAALEKLAWPGNVTELRNALETAVLQAQGQPLGPEHLPKREPSTVKFRMPPSGLDLRALEREVLTQALRLARGNRTRAASLLGLTRDQVRYRLSKLDDPCKVA